MATGVIPTLTRNTPILESPSDKLIYILKYMFFSPGWVSNWYDQFLLSMRKSMAKYTEDSRILVPQLQEYINESVHKYYPEYNCTIKVIRDSENEANYTMDIFIQDSIGNLVLDVGKVRKDDSGLFILEDR